MERRFLVHAAWALTTISTYLLGAQSARHLEATGEPQQAAAGSSRGVAGMQGDLNLVGHAEGLGPRPTRSSHRGKLGGRAMPTAAPGTLGMEEVATLVRSAVRSPNPLERRRAFDRILRDLQRSDLSAEQVVKLRQSMAEFGASGDQWRLLDYAWGASQPEAAVAYLDQIPAEYRDAYLGNMIPGLASGHPETAIELFESLEPDLQGRVRPRFLEGLVDNDIALATGYLYRSRDPENHDWRPMDTLAREIEKDRGLDSALSWAADLPEGPLRSNAWSAAYAVWAVRDPHAAVQSIVGMPQSADRDQAINGFISAHAHQDGERATTWAAEITSPGMREAAMIRAGRQFYSQDQQAAAQWFASSGLPRAAWEQLTASGR